MRKRLTARALAPLALALVVGGAVLFFCMARPKPLEAEAKWHGHQLGRCVQHMRYLAAAMNEYARDHGGRLPDAADWQAAVLPYLGNAAAELHEPAEEIVKCPAWRTETHPRGVPMGNGEYSYKMAPGLSGRLLQTVPDPARQPLLYDASADGAFTARHISRLDTTLVDEAGPHRQIQEQPVAVTACLDGRVDCLAAAEL